MEFIVLGTLSTNGGHRWYYYVRETVQLKNEIYLKSILYINISELPQTRNQLSKIIFLGYMCIYYEMCMIHLHCFSESRLF